MNIISTKEKILEVGHRLFSDKGVAAVGIREIAKEAEVNISAINYHFQNKENLYFETIKKCIVDTATQIHFLYQQYGDSPEKMVLALFDFFNENREDLRTNFKMLLSNDQIAFEKGPIFDSRDEVIGPPGGSALYDCLLNAVPNALEEDIIWAVRVLFSQVLQKSIILCNHCNKFKSKENVLSEEILKLELSKLIKVLLAELKNPKYPL